MVNTNEDVRKARETETCATCRFYVNGDVPGVAGGYCMRYPPAWESRGDDSKYGFPFTSPALWCGEWKGEYDG
jgi:hypothetical protein